MEFLRELIHRVVIAIATRLSGFLPDRTPMAFVGSDSIAELSRAMARGGCQRPLVVTDTGLVELGIATRVVSELTKAGLEPVVYDRVEPDPNFAQCQEGVAVMRSNGCDAVLALGGGSPMDAAKVIAGLATNDVPIQQLVGKLKLRNAPAPLFAIPTTAGTGSEATIVAVATDAEARAKRFFVDPKLLPEMVALDASLTAGLPPGVTAATGMDALTHAIESYIAVASNPFSDRLARSAVRMIFGNLRTAVANGEDPDARSAMLMASYYAGLAFSRTSLGYVHAISHQLGAVYKTPHGLANAIVLPHVLEFSKEAAEGRLADLADDVGAGGGSAADRANSFIAAVRELARDVGIPQKLESLSIADVPMLASRAVDEAHAEYPVPRYMTKRACEDLLADLLCS